MDGSIPEFFPHKGTIALFPFRKDIWRDNAIRMQEYMCGLVDIISKYECVYYFCDNRYNGNNNVVIIPAEYDDIWARDIGPYFIRSNSRTKCVDWSFNAWGGRKEGSYYPWHKDDAFASFVADYFGVEGNRTSIVVEGGGIITDGCGTVFTTQSVILNRNRNPFLSKSYVEERLCYYTGADRIVWLKQGLASDETNGHIDNVMQTTDKARDFAGFVVYIGI